VSDTLLWVYGVVPEGAEAPPDVTGVDGAPVHLHAHGNMVALVSEVPGERFDEQALKTRLEDMADLESLARAHEAVLEQALLTGTVVPLRLCTLSSSTAGLDTMLAREAPALTDALGRLTGMQEWGVKAYLAARAPAAKAPAPATGAEYFSRMREKRDATDARDDVIVAVHAALAERAADAVLSRPQDRRLSGRDADMALNAAYLVPTAGADAFRTTFETLERRHADDGLELELTGPWPPHHFVAAREDR
jgi:hypothetical protein